MQRGKVVEGKIILCPRNGYVGRRAVSNLPIYFDNHPEIAEAEGWKLVVFLDEPPLNSVGVEENGVIYEREGG